MSTGPRKRRRPAPAATIASTADRSPSKRRRAWLLAVAALAAASVTGLSAGATTPSLAENRPATADALAAALRNAGAHVKFEQKIRQPFFTVPATIFEVDGEGVQVFAFRDAHAAREAAATVSRDGRKIGASAPFWVGPPHFFRRSNLLVLYLGDDGQLIQRLQDALGPQFAGA